MIVLIILLALIALIFFVPYGVDAAYENGQARLYVRAGPVNIIRLFPKKPKTARQLEKERRKKEEKAAKNEAKKEEEEKPSEQEESADETIKVKKQRQLDFETVMALLEMGVHAIRRFFRSFTVDYFKLHCTMAGGDPYNTAMAYGYMCGRCPNTISGKHFDDRPVPFPGSHSSVPWHPMWMTACALNSSVSHL